MSKSFNILRKKMSLPAQKAAAAKKMSKEHTLEDIQKMMQPLADEMSKFGFEMHLVTQDNSIPAAKFKPEKNETDHKKKNDRH